MTSYPIRMNTKTNIELFKNLLLISGALHIFLLSPTFYYSKISIIWTLQCVIDSQCYPINYSLMCYVRLFY